MKTNFRKDFAPDTFVMPEQLPSTSEEAKQWQEANRSFWESHPMRYDWKEKVGYDAYTEPFYKEIDKRFFSNVYEYMPWKDIPFDTLIDFQDLKLKKVLEIGVGNGSHAQLLATYANSYTGIDLTNYAVKSTSERLKLFDIPGEIYQMDAEKMSFEDATFDFVWSWGVIHHSSNTEQILREIYRILKPGGEAVIMVYHRGWWNYYICNGLIHGIILGDIFRTRSLSKTAQNHTDGALARYYTTASWKNLAQELKFRVCYIVIKGQKSDLFPIPGGKIKNFLMNLIPNKITRFFTNQCNMGGFLISKILKTTE